LEAGPASGVGAGEVPVHGRVDDPVRSPGLEQTARQPFAPLEREPLAQGLELRRSVARVPGADAAQALVGRADFPDRPELPAERAADRLERGGVDLDRPFLFREDLRDLVLDALQALRVDQDRHGNQ
jgi:hypothetical protein